MKSAELAKPSRFSRILLAMTLRVVTALISGCATTNLNHADSGAPLSESSVLLERVSSEDAAVSEVHAVKDGGGLLIYGNVKRNADNCCDDARGHVDITLIGPDGEVVDLVSVPYSPRNIPKTRSRSARFVAKLPYLVPEGVPLRVSYHNVVEHESSADQIATTLSAHHPTKSDDKS